MKAQLNCKIAMVVPSLKNLGPIIVVENILKALNPENVIIISLRNNTETEKRVFKDYKIFELSMGKFPTSKTKKQILNIIQDNKVNLIHSHCYWPTVICSKISIKKITTVHNNPYIDYEYEYGRMLGYMMARRFVRTLKKFDKIICISEYIKQIINIDNSSIIYNSVEDIELKKNEEIVVDSNYLNLYTASVLNKRKNVSRMVEIIKSLVNEKYKVRLYIVGNGKEYNNISNLIQENNLESNIFMLGTQDKYFIKSLADKCDCLLFTSKSEGFGLTVAEALRDGKYIACSNFEVANELININLDGKVCDTNDDFIKYLTTIYNLKMKRKAEKLYSEINRKFYIDNFTNEQLGFKYINEYNQVSKKNIMYYIPFYCVGGIESLINQFIEKYNTKYNFSLLVEQKLKDNQIKYLEKNNVNIIEIPDMKKTSIINYIKEVNNVFKKTKIDIFHSNNYTLRFFPVMFSKMYNIKLRITHIHTSSFEGSKNIFLKKALAKTNLIFSNEIIICSEQSKKLINNKKVTLINNGIDSSKYKYNSDMRYKIRKKYKIKSNEKIIIQVGRLSEVKNHKFTIEIAKNLGDEYKFLILGDGELKNKIIDSINKNKLDKKFFLLGNVNNVEDYMSASDIFILPSLFEGMPLTLIEAVSNGLNCFISDTITKELDIFENIKYLNLSSKTWVDSINNTNIIENRDNLFKKVKESNYDINYFNERIEELYDK